VDSNFLVKFHFRYDYDACLLKLDKKVDLGALDAPTPICLPAPAQYDVTFEGKTPTVAGWVGFKN